MANKKLKSAAGVAEDQLKAGVKKLQEQLTTVEQVAGKLATKAKERLPAAAEVTALAKDAVAKRTTRGKRSGASRASASSAGGSTGGSTGGSASRSPGGSRPDDSWTVADLRAEAKRRGLTGYSRKSKAELLADLGG
jgi:hypothetical protein